MVCEFYLSETVFFFFFKVSLIILKLPVRVMLATDWETFNRLIIVH